MTFVLSDYFHLAEVNLFQKMQQIFINQQTKVL